MRQDSLDNKKVEFIQVCGPLGMNHVIFLVLRDYEYLMFYLFFFVRAL
jgi:hypothetical protein